MRNILRNLQRAVLLVALLIIQAPVLIAQEKLTGDWEGNIDVMGNQLHIITHFSETNTGPEGTIDIPQQGASGLALQDIAVSKDDSVLFAFFAGTGLAKFRGVFQGDSSITGTFIQNGRNFPFKLQKQPTNKKSEQQSQSDSTESEQQANKNKPYHQEELIIKKDSISIAGTLTWPKNKQSNHLVVMISGSGAQDRDETMKPVSNFKPFALLADSLTMNGVATFRYDDRGVGQSTGNFSDATLDILASDVKAIIERLKNHPDHSFSEIILLGHSQGGVVAGKVAAEYPDVDKLILMASSGLSLQEVLRYQVRQQFQKAGIDSEMIEKEINAREKLIEAVVKDQNIKQAKKEYRKIFESIQISAGGDSMQASNIAQKQVSALPKTFRSPQMQSLLFYDPTTDLRHIDIPVLVLFGGKDTQVPVKTNREPIKRALQSAGVDYKIKVFKNANHPFQPAQTGTVQEYSTLEHKFVDEFTLTISDWIKSQ